MERPLQPGDPGLDAPRSPRSIPPQPARRDLAPRLLRAADGDDAVGVVPGRLPRGGLPVHRDGDQLHRCGHQVRLHPVALAAVRVDRHRAHARDLVSARVLDRVPRRPAEEPLPAAHPPAVLHAVPDQNVVVEVHPRRLRLPAGDTEGRRDPRRGLPRAGDADRRDLGHDLQLPSRSTWRSRGSTEGSSKLRKTSTRAGGRPSCA
jgi:hypothetical protein